MPTKLKLAAIIYSFIETGKDYITQQFRWENMGREIRG
jgi:hypothetical protein